MRFDETLAALSSLVVEQVSCAVLWDWVMPHELDTLLHCADGQGLVEKPKDGSQALAPLQLVSVLQRYTQRMSVVIEGLV